MLNAASVLYFCFVTFLASGHYKGRCGGAEDAVSLPKMREEAKRLAQMMRGAPIVVVHTGAGLSTAAGERVEGGVAGPTTLCRDLFQTLNMKLRYTEGHVSRGLQRCSCVSIHLHDRKQKTECPSNETLMPEIGRSRVLSYQYKFSPNSPWKY